MNTEQENRLLKAMGPRGAQIVRALYDGGLRTFAIADAVRVTGVPITAVRKALNRLLKAGVIARVKPGIYNLVPFELGSQRQYVGSEPALATDVARRLLPEGAPFFLSYGTAMAIHQMVTQPVLTTYVSSSRRIRDVESMGVQIHFVTTAEDRLFGYEDTWVSDRQLPVSDVERTILDGLLMPSYVGGIGEVAKAIWMKRGQIDQKKLVEYTRRLGVGAVASRLAYLLSIYGIASAEVLDELRDVYSSAFHLLDPDLPAEGSFDSKWRLRLNVPEEELRSIVRT